MSWIQKKKQLQESFEKHVSEIDKDVLDFFEWLNKYKDIQTSSSCSGRIVVLELESPGDKVSAKFLGKWHSLVEFQEVHKAISKRNKGTVWFKHEPAIIHFYCSSIDLALELRKIASEAGFKRSSVISVKPDYVVLEIRGNESLDVPIVFSDFMVNDFYLGNLVQVANELLEQSKKHLRELEKSFKEFFKMS